MTKPRNRNSGWDFIVLGLSLLAYNSELAIRYIQIGIALITGGSIFP